MDGNDAGTAQRVHELRIGLESSQPLSTPPGPLREVLDGSLPGWRIDTLLTDDSELWLIRGRVDEHVGTPEYARRAHTLVQEILTTGVASRAEADLPVTAFGRSVDALRSSDAAEFPPGSEVRRWARDAIRCDDAWSIEPTRGAGIRIGHPDTGYTVHPRLGRDALDLETDRDLIDDDDDALDPLMDPDHSPWPLPFPGHGTTTASVMAGQGTEERGIVGVAPGSRVVPLRAVESVVQLFDSDVARAVDHARSTGCDLVSISVGGKGFFGLRAAIQRAVDAGMLVMAAAGNNVRIVVAPASYPNCLAVAATGPDGQPWPESSRGRAVDVSAPGWGVHVAGYEWVDGTPHASVFRSSGSSYAVAHVAGAAALWLAHHGPEALRARYGAGLQDAFRRVLVTAGSRVPEGWDAGDFGSGIVDAAGLLAATLPSPDDTIPRRGGAVDAPITRLAAMVNESETDLETALAGWFGLAGPELRSTVARFEGELAFHLVEEPALRASILSGSRTRAARIGVPASCSPAFAATFL
ncbi:hypothetical protein IWX78_003049 [Mycetocola sp. CAN_C7]|uniref:S8 family peptidase n=1 Tax=Mycetocola sp. CAN_C7 TaxID=2787724 RepID=UPI0018C9985F